MKPCQPCLFALRVAAAVLGMTLAAAALGPGEFRFEYAGGMCTLEASEARLVDVLATIASDTGIDIQYDKDDPSTTSQSLNNVDLERLMRALAENVVMAFVADDTSPQGYRMVRAEFSAAADEAAKAQAARQQAAAARAPTPPRPGTRTVPVKYSGIGAHMAYTQDRKGLQFRPVKEDVPVTRAGITPEDVVVAVEGKPVSSFRSLSEVSRIVRGREGTPVELSVRKPNGAVVRTRVVRANVEYQVPVPQRRPPRP